MRWMWRLAATLLCSGSLLLSGLLVHAQAPPTTAPQESPEAHLASLRTGLMTAYGYDEAWFARPEASYTVALAILRAEDEVTHLTSVRDEALMLRGASQLIRAQLGVPRLKKTQKKALATQLADNLARQVKLQATAMSQEMAHDARRAHIAQLDEFVTAQRVHAAQVAEIRAQSEQESARLREQEVKESEQKRLDEEKKRLQEQNLKLKAEADLEKIKDRQRLATTQQIKELLGTQELLAQRVIKITDIRPEVEQNFNEINEINLKKFTQTKDELDLFLEQLPDRGVALKSDKQALVDTLFENVRKTQRDARQSFLKTRAMERELEAEQRVATTERDNDEEKLNQAQKAYDEGKSELGQARLELATTRAKLSRLEAELITLRLDDARAHHARLDQELSYYFAAKEILIERISDKKRAAFYALTSDQNWKDARLGAQLAFARLLEQVSHRGDMFLEVLANPLSINLWSWIGSLILRLLVVITLVYLVNQRAPGVIKSLMRVLLKRSFFRKHATITLKGGEVLRHLVAPTVRFIGWTYMLGFGQQILPELRFVQWFINAIYIFRALTLVISVVVLPRTVREPKNNTERVDPAQAWRTAGGAEATGDEESVDLFALEISRARKLVLSARVITVFWLIVIYVPAFSVEFIGHTVIWRLIDLATTWGFILVIYSVLSTWRDEIARLFEKLAIERLPRAVHFVNQNKDRVWGVLVIAGASLYVIGSESLRLGKRYLIETQWSKQISNFIFRKQIEYKQRDRDKQDEDQNISFSLKNLPPRYIDFFENRPLADEVYHVESNQKTRDTIMAHFVSWRSIPNQGSVALHGEAGMGRSTLLFELAESLDVECEAQHIQMVYTRLIERCVEEHDILTFIAQLFALEAPKSRASLIEQINALPTHVLLIDDCQRLFLRKIGGFNGLETFLQIVNLTDGHHFWVLTFERFAWNYLARIKQRAHYFGEVLELEPWTDTEIQDLVWKRNLMTGLTANFTNLVVTRDNGEEDVSFEVIKSAQGYFRLLHDFSKGNPRVAMLYWLRSIKQNEEDDTVIDVGLFRSPSQKPLTQLQDNYWFTLTAIAQHGALNSKEIASVINAEEGFCEMAVNYFQEKHIVSLDANRRAKLTPVYLRQILKQLTISNYLYD